MPGSPVFSPSAKWHTLSVHPIELAPIGLKVSASVSFHGSGPAASWLLRYRLEGEIDALALPEPAPAGPADGLWRHTCLEAFVLDGDGPGYHEFNFSPSGQWAVYRFVNERQRLDNDAPPLLGPTISVERTGRPLTLEARLPQALLPTRPTRIGLNAVIETLSGEISHWALQHPRSERPDFHHPGAWTLPVISPH